MRIVIDMQGAQTESRYRGIGRYSLSFAQAVVRNRGEHEIILALNGLFPETIEPIRATFDKLLPQDNIRVWHTPSPVLESCIGNDVRLSAAEHLRESFLASLSPDIVHISSLFEGYIDNAVTSIGNFDHTTPVSVSLYDLIPLINPDYYLKQNLTYQKFYKKKIDYLNRANIYLAISEFTRQEAIEHLNTSSENIVNISAAIESCFKHYQIEAEDRYRLFKKYGINTPFILYTGGSDERKNLPRLIQAFAALPASLRNKHQLLLAGKMPEGNIDFLIKHAKSSGLQDGDLNFTGYVTNKELIQLYNLCTLYIFPSWHEGFGLPVLEAMACGAPVISANTSSLPEVNSLDEALFDPHDVTSITNKMLQVLENCDFRKKLCAHGLKQVKLFSWNISTKRAIATWELFNSKREISANYIERSLSQYRLIQSLAKKMISSDDASLISIASCLSKNQNTGFQRQLMLDISELAQRDAATGVQRVVRSYLKALLHAPPSGFRVEPVYATRDDGYRYARRFIQGFLGQDSEHLIDNPVQWQRGDIFFGLDMQHHVQLAHMAFYQQLRIEGVTVKFLIHDLLPIQLADLFKDSNARELHEQWLAMIAVTDGAICVSKATADAYNKWIDESTISGTPNFQLTWVHIGSDIKGSNPSQGMPDGASKVLDCLRSRPSFLCVATLEPRKGQQQIVDALQLIWEEGLDINLVLVGQQGWKMEALAETIHNHPERDQRLFWLQGISDEYLEQVYSASTCLIAASINEGFGLPLIEAARHAIPIIARNITVFREVAGDYAFYFTGETPRDLATALKAWIGLYQNGCHPKSNQLRWSTWQESVEKLKVALVEENYPRRQLLVDVSELVQHDAKSGIQRVVRNIFKEWLNYPPAGYRVEPVFATMDRGYRYARHFTQGFLGCQKEVLQDEPIEYAPGDVFFGLDFQPQLVPAHRAFYQALRCQGVRVMFVVYDLLCVLMPQQFPHGTADGFSQWLEVVAESDGALCISKAVADELTEWVNKNGQIRQRQFTIDWFHLGADVDNSSLTRDLLADAVTVLERIRGSNSFLMVGTLEPRKGHWQVLEAFDQLWTSAQDVNLIIIGKQGWMVENLVDRLRTHSELNKRLFWLDGISDEYLEKVYSNSTCLIAASYGEGFGLPLIEAAQHKLPIIARDIPVFREVAGEHAFYFVDKKPSQLTRAIEEWIEFYQRGNHPKSDNMPWLTWRESAQRLLKTILPEAELNI